MLISGSIAHLHCNRGPIKQLCLVNLGQAGSSYGLIVKRFEKLLWSFVEVFLEKSIHLSDNKHNLRTFIVHFC